MAKTIPSIIISGFSCIFLLVEVVYLVAVLVEKCWRTKYQSEMVINPDVWKESKFSVKFKKLFLNDLFLQRVLVLVCAITHSLITLSTAQLSDQSVSKCLLWNMTSTVLFTVGKYSMFLFLYGKQRVLKDRLQDKVSREEKVIFALIHLLPVVGFLIAITRKYALSDYVCTVTTPFGALGLLALAAMLYLAISLHLLNLFLEVISKNITKRSSKRRASSKSPSKRRKSSAAKRKSSGGDSVGFRDSQDSSVHKSAEGLALDIHPAPNVSSESLQQPSPSTVVQERVMTTQSSRRSSVAVNLANLESSGIIIPKTALRQPHFDLMELNKESCLISIVSFLVVVFIGAVMTRINAQVIAHSVELIINNGNLLIDSFAMMMCSPQVWFVFSGLLRGNKIGGDGQKSPDASVGLSDRRISASIGNVSGELAGVHLSNPVQAMITPKASQSKRVNAA